MATVRIQTLFIQCIKRNSSDGDRLWQSVDLQTQSRQMRVAIAFIAANLFPSGKLDSDMYKRQVSICDGPVSKSPHPRDWRSSRTRAKRTNIVYGLWFIGLECISRDSKSFALHCVNHQTRHARLCASVPDCS